VEVLFRINREDAKSAKKSAKQNSFQAAKDSLLSSTVIADSLTEHSSLHCNPKVTRRILG